MAGRILVVRGGAIGDFILTLPAIHLIRDAFPETHLEILGYRSIIELAENRFYADAVRSIEYGPLAGFFHPSADLNPELVAYFASFNQVVSYLFDPDEIFARNLSKAGVLNLIVGPGKLDDSAHASAQLAAPLTRLGLFLENRGARIYPNDEDFSNLRQRFGDLCGGEIAMHPGSGSESKNWPLDSWKKLIETLVQTFPSRRLVLLGGEADQVRLNSLRDLFGVRVSIVDSERLPTLAAFLSRCAGFIGHDSGMSHLAAASGAPCLLMFGPTDPVVWAPRNLQVQYVVSPSGQMSDIALESILSLVDTWKL